MIGDRKRTIETIAAKNRIIENIIEVMLTRENFLLLGHKTPDEDCVSSLVGFALLLSKFGKSPVIYLSHAMSKRYGYMIGICRFNSIQVVTSFKKSRRPVDVITIIDTPKPAMVDASVEIQRMLRDDKMLKMEIDHHIGADGAYNGFEGYCLVTEASSAAELVGHLAMKLNDRRQLLHRYQIAELFSRNLVLSLLTGIIADSNMGRYLKSRRERRYYEIFSNMFNTMLARETVKDTNFANMNQVFSELKHLSSNEETCFRTMLKKRKKSKSIYYVVLDHEESRKMFERHDHETVVSVSRSITDRLAEDSGKLGLVCYYDDLRHSDLIQFRLRRNPSYKVLDLREILTLLSIENGGGHEGAIGFRFPQSDVADLKEYVRTIIPKIEEALAAAI
jgi:nanoRNase/pAp phosphatase (c-di-AMP/oligoRNAs hydrolase)